MKVFNDITDFVVLSCVPVHLKLLWTCTKELKCSSGINYADLVKTARLKLSSFKIYSPEKNITKNKLKTVKQNPDPPK